MPCFAFVVYFHADILTRCFFAGVILAPDEIESLKTLLTSSDEDCASGELLSFDILYTESGVEKKKTDIILHCTDGHTARKDNMQTAINAAFDTGEIPIVSLVGETSIVIAFSPLVSKVEIVVPEAYNGNKYGMLNDTVTKSSVSSFLCHLICFLRLRHLNTPHEIQS